MNDATEILTKVYGYVNRIKIRLAFKDIAGIWKVVNELSDYLVSIDIHPVMSAPDLCLICGKNPPVTGRSTCAECVNWFRTAEESK